MARNREQNPMSDQRIESEEEFDAAWNDDAAASGDDQAAADDFQDELAEGAEDESQTPENDADAGEGDGGQDQASSDDADLKKQLEAAEQRWKSEQGRIRKIEERSSKFEQEVKELRAKLAPAESTDGDDSNPEGMSDEEWEAFKEDFPEIAKQMEAQKAQLEQVGSVVGELKAEREQSRKEQEKAKQEAHDQTIREVHEDYDDLAKDPAELLAFVERQSPLQQRIYREVMEQGSAEEVIGLLDAFKTDKSANQPEPTTPNNGNKKPNPTLAVKTRRSRPNLNAGKVDNDDFDGAWEEANKKG